MGEKGENCLSVSKIKYKFAAEIVHHALYLHIYHNEKVLILCCPDGSDLGAQCTKAHDSP